MRNKNLESNETMLNLLFKICLIKSITHLINAFMMNGQNKYIWTFKCCNNTNI